MCGFPHSGECGYEFSNKASPPSNERVCSWKRFGASAITQLPTFAHAAESTTLACELEKIRSGRRRGARGWAIF
jgi:predicted DNA-binding WGR domain protein